MPDGTKKVETPPLPATGRSARQRPAPRQAGCHGGAWLMVETADGLRRVHRAYARPGTCRASTYRHREAARGSGSSRRGGQWLQCQLPDIGSKCVNMFARPPDNLPFQHAVARRRACSPGSASQFDGILNTYVLGVVSALMTAIAPIALTAMTIWVALYGWAVLRNEVSETLPVFMWKVFKIGLVLRLRAAVGLLHRQRRRHGERAGDGRGHRPSCPPASTRRRSPRRTRCSTSSTTTPAQQVLDIMKEAGIVAARPAARGGDLLRSARSSSCASRSSSSRWRSSS